jgi:hypothetical protein
VSRTTPTHKQTQPRTQTQPPAGDRRRSAPGSVRHSLAVLAVVAAAGTALIGLTDGLPAASAAVALTAAGGLALARYVAGGGAQDSDRRKTVRLLDGRAPALGEWRRIVDRAFGEGGDVHAATTLRAQLQRLFAARLAERHGVELHRAPDRARGLVGPELWPWIDPAGPPPGPELSEPVLRALLDRLEAL